MEKQKKIKIKHNIRTDFFDVSIVDMENLILRLGEEPEICQIFRHYIRLIKKDLPNHTTVLITKEEIKEFNRLYRKKNEKQN